MMSQRQLEANRLFKLLSMLEEEEVDPIQEWLMEISVVVTVWVKSVRKALMKRKIYCLT